MRQHEYVRHFAFCCILNQRWKCTKRRMRGAKVLRLYHITDEKAGKLICETNEMLRGSKGMFGGGIYFAESVKSAKHKALHHGYLVEADVWIGKELRVPKADIKYRYMTFTKLKARGCDSLWAPNGSGKGECERVVYNKDQVQIISIKKL